MTSKTKVILIMLAAAVALGLIFYLQSRLQGLGVPTP